MLRLGLSSQLLERQGLVFVGHVIKGAPSPFRRMKQRKKASQCASSGDAALLGTRVLKGWALALDLSAIGKLS